MPVAHATPPSTRSTSAAARRPRRSFAARRPRRSLRRLLPWTLVLTAVVLAHVRVRADEILSATGAGLLSQSEGGNEHDGRLLSINGLGLKLRVQASDRSIGEVLDRSEDECKRLAPPLYELAPFVEPLLRMDAPDHGYVACFESGGQKRPGDLLQRLRNFIASGDLSDLGRLHFVYAESGPGGSARVELLSLPGFNIARAFPETGDAPGTDGPLPRPRGSVRTMSVGLDGTEARFTLHRLQAPIERVIAEHRTQLEQAGYRVSQPGQDAEAAATWLVEGHGRQQLVRIIDEGDQVLIASSELR
ncbi:MAG: hypothetical protein OEZ06_02480 [Myxococcales bacterium]|nr:hypothetical protein [Myxococcales bacterium]